jgi:hypothetical protein
MDGEGWRLRRDDSIHSFCICMMIGDGMGYQKLGSKVH